MIKSLPQGMSGNVSDTFFITCSKRSYGGDAEVIRKRIASIDDSAIYRLIIEQLVPLSKVYESLPPPRQTDIFKRLRPNTTYVVASGRRYPLGFVSMYRKDRTLIVDMLAVNPAYRGRGYGKVLMEAAERFGRKKGCVSVQLYVDDKNNNAIGFYQSRGYSSVHYDAHIACYVMSKPLRRV
jgi:GNAT superfamily N-acetyltransferase